MHSYRYGKILGIKYTGSGQHNSAVVIKCIVGCTIRALPARRLSADGIMGIHIVTPHNHALQPASAVVSQARGAGRWTHSKAATASWPTADHRLQVGYAASGWPMIVTLLITASCSYRLSCFLQCRVLQTACIERMPNSQQSSLQQHARSSFIVRASRKQNSSAEDPNKVWRLKDLLTSNDGDDQSSCSASNDHQQQAINSHSASNKFPAQQWSGEQQAKQQYRQQQWELWNQRQQQLERRERIKAWQEAQQQQQQQMDAAAGPQGEQHMPYAYDQTRWKVRNQQWRSGAPPRWVRGHY